MILDLLVVLLRAICKDLLECNFLLLDVVAGEGVKLSEFANLVWRTGTDGVAVGIHGRLLPHVQPDDLAVLWVDVAAHLVKDIFEAVNSGLTAAVDLRYKDNGKDAYKEMAMKMWMNTINDHLFETEI